MTWEETIQMIRTKPEYEDLVRLAYFEAELPLNVTRFQKSDEFKETLKIISQFHPKAETILDIGSGNGISAVSFALEGYNVTAVEPDSSNTVGAGAIRELKAHYKLDSLQIFESLAEDIDFPDSSFDIVYIRQAMHHAHDLECFLKESVRVLKPGGLLLTIRDHVIYNQKDKEWFLENHPLQKFYQGENAFTTIEYRSAIQKAGATIIKELKYFDNVINYFPLNCDDLEKLKYEFDLKQRTRFNRKAGFLSKMPFTYEFYKLLFRKPSSLGLDETKVPGRMYSYIALKK